MLITAWLVQPEGEDQEMEVVLDDLTDATLWKLEALMRKDLPGQQGRGAPGKAPGRQVQSPLCVCMPPLSANL